MIVESAFLFIYNRKETKVNKLPTEKAMPANFAKASKMFAIASKKMGEHYKNIAIVPKTLQKDTKRW